MRANQVGFTLLELIVTMTVASILFGVGIPSLISTLRTNRLAGATNELISTLIYARSEAIKRSVPVGVCRSSDGAACVTSGSAGWAIGWLVYVDVDRSSALNTGDIVLTTHEALDSSITLTGNNNVANQVLFTSIGLANTSNGTMTMTSSSDTRTICIATSGRARLMPKGSTCTS